MTAIYLAFSAIGFLELQDVHPYPPGSMPFQCIWTGNFVPGWRAPEHQHPHEWEVLLIRQGTLDVHVGGKHHHGLPGSVFVYAPRTVHWEENTAPADLRMTGLLWGQGKRPVVSRTGHFHDSSGRTGFALQWISDLQNAFGSRLPIYEGLIEALLFEFRRVPDAIGDDRMGRIRSYISQASHGDLTVKKLAKVAHMSERHFAREFHRQTQTTPMAYVRRIRLEKASAAITQGDLPMREIARQCGFRDEFELSRVFRRERGFAPSLLRLGARSRTK